MKTSKKILAVLLAVLMVFGTFSVGFTAIAATRKVTKLSLNKTSLKLYTTQTYALKPTVSPSNATNKSVTWKSGNTKIAKVSSSGKVTAVKAGKTTITCTAKDGSGKKAVCKVTVTKKVNVSKVSLGKSKLSLYTTQTYTLKPTVSPSNASVKTVKYKSSNSKVAKVSSKGVITAVKAGTATITCTSADNSSKKSTCKVTVKKKVNIKSLSLDVTSATVYTGNTYSLEPVFSPENTSNKEVTWKSSNKKVATVSSDGTVEAVKPGKVTITCTSKDNTEKKAVCKITVKDKIYVKKIELSESQKSVYTGDMFTLTKTVSPSNATNRTVKWYSGDKSIVTVSSSGVVTAVSAGTANIVCKAKDGSGKKGICKVTVTDRVLVSSVKLDKTSASLAKGEQLTLNAEVLPENADNLELEWSSSNNSVANVTEDGVVTAVGGGVAVITANAMDGSGCKATCTVNVNVPLTGLKLSQTSVRMGKGTSTTLTCTAIPSDASDKEVVFSTSDKNVATVTQAGKVTAVSEGKAVITCKSVQNDKITATCEVEVTVVKVTNIVLSKTEVSVYPGASVELTANVVPATANDRSVKWSTSNDKVATVTQSGKLTAVGKGTANIVCTANDGSGVSATCKVTVDEYVKTITIKSSRSTWEMGDSGVLTAEVLPATAKNRSVKWTTSDSTCVSVDNNGNATAKRPGSAVITCTALDGSGVKATYTVTVTGGIKVTSVAFTSHAETWYVGQTGKVTATVYPYDATEKGVTYTTSDSSVVAINADGSLTAKKAGTATITAKSDENPSISDKMTITVSSSEIMLSIGSGQDAHYAGKATTLSVTSNPSTIITGSGVKLEVENPDILTITLTSSQYAANVWAVVKFLKPGTTRIRAVTLDGAKTSAWYTITVKGLVVDKTFFDGMSVGKTAQINAYVSNGSKMPGETLYYSCNEYSDYFTVTSSGLVTVKKALPAAGAYVVVSDSSGNLTERIYFASGNYDTPSTSDGISALLKKVNNYTLAASKNASSCTQLKTVGFTNTKVTDSKLNMSSDNIFVAAMLKVASIGMDDSEAENLIYELFNGETTETAYVKGNVPPVVTVSESNVASIAVNDEGDTSYSIILRLKDDTSTYALDDIGKSPFSKAVPVIGKTYLDGYIDKIKGEVASSMGDEAKVEKISYGTVKEKYSNGYVIVTVDKVSDRIIKAEYHFKTDMNIQKANLKMKVYIDLSDPDDVSEYGSSRIDVTMTTTASFTTTVEETYVFSNYYY